MNRHRVWIFTISLLMLVPLSLTPAWAASEDNQDPANTATGTVFRWLNFAVVVGLLGYGVRNAILPALRKRVEGIRRAIAAGGEAQAAAEEELRRMEARLVQLDQEVAALRAAAQRETDAEATRIRDLAREECDKIGRAAQVEIEAASRAARIELRRLVARNTVNQAESFIREQINANTRASLVQSFLADLERREN